MRTFKLASRECVIFHLDVTTLCRTKRNWYSLIGSFYYDVILTCRCTFRLSLISINKNFINWKNLNSVEDCKHHLDRSNTQKYTSFWVVTSNMVKYGKSNRFYSRKHSAFTDRTVVTTLGGKL